MIHKNNIHEGNIPIRFNFSLLFNLVIFGLNVVEIGFPARTEADSRNLDLYNFESEEAIYSSYILTSPRSLKACCLANVKVGSKTCYFFNFIIFSRIYNQLFQPIELLHRSINEIAADLGLDTCQVNHIYFDYEQERLSKFFFLNCSFSYIKL